MALTIYCSSCNEHAFKVDERTVANAGIVSLKCPQCGKGTSVGAAPGGNITVVPGYPDDHLPGKGEKSP